MCFFIQRMNKTSLNIKSVSLYLTLWNLKNYAWSFNAFSSFDRKVFLNKNTIAKQMLCFWDKIISLVDWYIWIIYFSLFYFGFTFAWPIVQNFFIPSIIEFLSNIPTRRHILWIWIYKGCHKVYPPNPRAFAFLQQSI